MTFESTSSPLLDEGNPEDKRAELRAYFHSTFDLTEKLFETLACEEAFYRRADPLRHPLVFYYGHTAVFFINKLTLAKLLHERVVPRFESMFAIGVDEMSWDDLDDTHYDWPPIAEVVAYRERVREVVDQVIATMPLKVPITWEDPAWAILMGIEHERIHIETSSVLIRQLPLELVREHREWPLCPHSGDAPRNELLEVAGGTVVLGKRRDHPLYGWDNEYGRHVVEVPSFRASRYLVSNAEFRAFVEDGGYREPDYWSEEGRRWLAFREPIHPIFWIPAGPQEWRLRCLFKEIPMPWDWPVEVNFLEAKAFTNWLSKHTSKNLRLPSEEEWYRLLEVAGLGELEDWSRAPANVNLQHQASPGPVARFMSGGFGDVIGNVWQWTETPIAGFPGFAVHPLYDDFSTPTFDTRHNLIKGGSWISTGNEATKRSRYAFRRHFFQHAGLRYIESEHKPATRHDVYETDALISQYCEFHYGEEYFGVPNFPAELAHICAELCSGRPHRTALDLGCATGRTSFELARFFERVTGIDFSARFIQVALEMKEKGYIKYALPEEGELVSYHEKRISNFDLEETRSRVTFHQGDAHNLKESFTDYDLVLGANLIDRLYNPGLFLRSIHERIHPGGLLVIASPYTWLEEFTAREEWLGGYKRDGENLSTLDGIEEILSTHFRRLGEVREIPFVIRETRRKFQHSLSELSVWERLDSPG